MHLAQWNEPGAYETPVTVATEVPYSAIPETSPDWMTNLSDIVSAVTAYDLQRKLLDLNIARAEAGLPAIDVSQYSPGVNVGLAPQTQQFATIALLGLGALALFAMRRRR